MIRKLTPVLSLAGTTLQRTGGKLAHNLLSLGGLGAFVVGGFETDPRLGWAVAGVALLVLEWLMGDAPAQHGR